MVLSLTWAWTFGSSYIYPHVIKVTSIYLSRFSLHPVELLASLIFKQSTTFPLIESTYGD